MLTTIQNALKTKEIRMKLLYVLIALVIVRIGSNIPIPGINASVMQEVFNNNQSLGFLDVMTGGSFSRMSIFALNITPYITSSIIMQLLTIAIPALEEMHKDGEDGRKKIVEITRYLTVGLALFEASAMTFGFWRSGYLAEKNVLTAITVVTALTAGSAVLMWIGEQITEKGVGNGISIVLVINIISRIPADMGNLWDQFVAGQSFARGAVAAIIILAIIIGMVIFVIVLQGGQRKIPVQ